MRFIGNRSSGKQGYALAEAAQKRGAEVTLITTVDAPTVFGAKVIKVESAAEMEAAVRKNNEADIIIMAAAVADFRPSKSVTTKIKKDAGAPAIILEETSDILAGLGASKKKGQILVGFAAETDDLIKNASKKLVQKNIDAIVANDVSAEGVGFTHETNAVTILMAGGHSRSISLRSKREVAEEVLNTVVDLVKR